jgi:hypothetical protein
MKTNGLTPKKAKKVVEYIVYSIPCPWCEQVSIENPQTGSVDWTRYDLQRYIETTDRVVNCQYCGNPVRI